LGGLARVFLLVRLQVKWKILGNWNGLREKVFVNLQVKFFWAELPNFTGDDIFAVCSSAFGVVLGYSWLSGVHGPAFGPIGNRSGNRAFVFLCRVHCEKIFSGAVAIAG